MLPTASAFRYPHLFATTTAGLTRSPILTLALRIHTPFPAAGRSTEVVILSPQVQLLSRSQFPVRQLMDSILFQFLLIILVTERRTSGSDHLSPGVMRYIHLVGKETNPQHYCQIILIHSSRKAVPGATSYTWTLPNGIYVGKRQSHGSVCTNQNSQL